METRTQARKLTRCSITKLCNKIDNELNKENPVKVVLMAYREDLCRLNEAITVQDDAVITYMLANDETEENQFKEVEDSEAYRNKISLCLMKIEEQVRGNGSNGSEASSYSTVLDPSVITKKTKRTYKLPKIEIKKFNGEILEWLSFWSQFEKIHTDDDLHNSDKFQYLSQAMVDGTRAKELVNSYPQTSDNYPKVINALKDRFGKKKMLKQVYVRELIKMIAIKHSKDKVPLSQLFDKLESHIRALESLGVTDEQTSEFLFPMVESALPEDILIAWQRSVNFNILILQCQNYNISWSF